MRTLPHGSCRIHGVMYAFVVLPAEVLAEDIQESVENDAEHLYGLIHARFILTGRGLQAMVRTVINAIARVAAVHLLQLFACYLCF